jgi:hypothetical protein
VPDRKGVRTYNTNIMFLSRFLYDSSVAALWLLLCFALSIMCETRRSSFGVRIPFPTCCICKEQGTCTGPHPDSIRQKKSRRERCTTLDWPPTVRFRVKAPRYLTRKAVATMRLEILKPPRRTTNRKSRASPYACKFCYKSCPSTRLRDFTGRPLRIRKLTGPIWKLHQDDEEGRST